MFFLFGVVVCCLCEVNGGGDCVTLGGGGELIRVGWL